jgi:hypothetical protein
MSAVVLVLQNPYFAKPNAQGEFTIPNVPDGNYSVRVYRLSGAPLAQKQVKVSGEDSATLQF